MIPPRVFNIRSSISVLLPTKYCAVSIKSEKNTFYRFARQQRCKKTDGNKKSDIAEQIYPKRIVMSVSVIGTDKPENAERFKVYIAVIRKNKFNSVSVQVHFGQKRL